ADRQVSEYWIDRGPPCAYQASASFLRWSRQRAAAQRAAPEPDLAVLVVAPRLGAETGLAALPHSEREALGVAGALRAAFGQSSACLLLGADATRARLSAEAPRARWIDLATHHRVGSDSTLNAMLLGDGPLTLSNLLLDWVGRLPATRLVVLGACETQN